MERYIPELEAQLNLNELLSTLQALCREGEDVLCKPSATSARLAYLIVNTTFSKIWHLRKSDQRVAMTTSLLLQRLISATGINVILQRFQLFIRQGKKTVQLVQLYDTIDLLHELLQQPQALARILRRDPLGSFHVKLSMGTYSCDH